MRNSLRAQLLLSHLVLVGLMLAVMLIAVAGFFRLGQSVDRLLKENYKSVIAAQDMKEALERMDSAATFFLAGQTEKARKQYVEYRPRFEAAYQIEVTNITEPGEEQIARDLGASFAHYRKDIERLLYANPPLSPADGRALYFGHLEPSFLFLKQQAHRILDLNQSAIVRADRRARGEAQTAALFSVGLTAAAVLLGLGLALRNLRALMTPVVSLIRQAEQIGAGYLNQRIETRRTDEIGQLAASFNEMAAKLEDARRAAEARFQRAERMSDIALDNLYDPVIVTDAMGNVAHLNRAAEGLFGPEIRARERSARSVVSDERLAQAIERAIQQEQVSAEEGEAARVRIGGRTYRLRANPMTEDDGTLLGAVAVLEDVTHLTELDRLKTEFIGVASHELRTPVTSLLLSVQLLQEGAVGTLTPEQTDIVNAQRQDLERLDRMMRDLLDLTRLEAGAMPPRFEVVAPLELLTQARSAVEAQAEKKGIAVRLTGSHPGLPAVRADQGQIGRVLVNLVSNALRHTPRGGKVTLTAEPTGDGMIRFAVTDTGVGIPAEYLPRIFERFVQVPGATRGGAGLGLSLSEAIIRAHGGEMRAESEVGKGSTFWFTLPAAEASAESETGTGETHGTNSGRG
jgi:two-component system, NtrC family, sensor histidine kinase KinB